MSNPLRIFARMKAKIRNIRTMRRDLPSGFGVRPLRAGFHSPPIGARAVLVTESLHLDTLGHALTRFDTIKNVFKNPCGPSGLLPRYRTKLWTRPADMLSFARCASAGISSKIKKHVRHCWLYW